MIAFCVESESNLDQKYNFNVPKKEYVKGEIIEHYGDKFEVLASDGYIVTVIEIN